MSSIQSRNNQNSSSQQIRSILEELESIATRKDNSILFENRVVSAITAAINAIDLIKHEFPGECDLLEKKFLLAIKGKQSSKFTNALRNIKDEKYKNSSSS